MTARFEADVVIVGLGAAGGIAAHVLCQLGASVVAVEAGPFLRGDDFVADELGGAAYRNDLGPKFNHELPVLYAEGRSPRLATTSPIGRMVNAVGGSTIHYAGWSRRFQPGDFRALSSTIERYGEGAVPDGCTLVDWPIGYDDLEPYYGRVERLIGVSGIAHRVAGRPPHPGGNPFEGLRTDEYPLPPLRAFAYGERFRRAAQDAGLNPYPVPAAVLSEDFEGRPACSYCGWCLGQGCPYGSKSSTLVTAVPSALDSGRLTLLSGVTATGLDVEDGRAHAVRCLDAQGRPAVVEAGVVVLAAYTFENTRLLFLSCGRGHEAGLGNSSGQLGWHFMSRQAVEVFGLHAGEDLELREGPAGQAMCIDDLNGDNFDHAALGFIRGGSVGVESELTPIRAAKSVPPWIPRWGRRYKSFLIDSWRSIGCLRALPEPLPYAGNELWLDPQRRDDGPARLPRLAVRYTVRANEQRMAEFLAARMSGLAGGMGAGAVWRGPLGFNVLSGHDVGGIRMGADPGTSVVDPYGRVHDTDNVYVLGGATFPTATGINPTLTIQALAWRTAEHIAARVVRPGAACHEVPEVAT